MDIDEFEKAFEELIQLRQLQHEADRKVFELKIMLLEAELRSTKNAKREAQLFRERLDRIEKEMKG